MTTPIEELELLHERSYVVRVYRRHPTEIVARGTMRDEKPPGLYVADDPEPLTIHQMTVELAVEYPSLTIVGVDVQFGTHPHAGCPGIAATYGGLVGLSISRGFTHKTRELFGGPRGCTHVTALLQAMAPAVVQSTWSMHIRNQLDDAPDDDVRAEAPAKDLAARQLLNVGTCHIWAEDGEHVALVRKGEAARLGIPIRERLLELGQDPEQWANRHM